MFPLHSDQPSYRSHPARQDHEQRLKIGDAYVSSWWTEGEPESLERAVVAYRSVLTQSSSDELNSRYRAQISLSDTLRLQYEDGLGEKEEEELFREALDLAESAVAGTAPRSDLHLHALRALGQVLFRRFHTKEHIQRATDTFQALVDMSSETQSSMLIIALAWHSMTLNNQFQHKSGDREVLRLANVAVDRALALIPEGENLPYDLLEAHSIVRSSLGQSSQDLAAIDEAIAVMRSLIDTVPSKHPRVPYYWSAVGWTYWYRYKLTGAAQDIDCHVMAYDRARKGTPRRHPMWISIEGNYAISLYQRFQARGDLSDLQQATDVARASVREILSAPPQKSYLGDAWVNNLVDYLTERYSQTGDLELLDEGIGLLWDNLKKSPLSRRGMMLHSIAIAYRSRFLAQGRLTDLQRAVSVMEEASEYPLASVWHADALHTLADLLLVLYMNEQKDISTLDRTISLLQASLLNDGLQAQARGQHQSLLGLALMTHARATSSVQCIEDSIESQKLALDLVPQEDPRRWLCYFRLGLAEYQRFVIGRHREGVDNSISALDRALSLMPMDHADRASYLLHLSKSLLALSDLAGPSAPFVEALKRLREAAAQSTSWPADRYEAAVLWASASHKRGYHSQAIEAYRLAISLLPELASVRMEDELRMRHIGKQAREIPQDAAACALELGQPELAVELLEAGRTLLWNARQELRTDLARLGEVAPDLARELAQTNAALEFRPPSDSTDASVTESEAERRRLHRLASRRTELIRRIRSCAGFERFLCPPEFSSLRNAAFHGPVIVLNASAYRCDAILIRADKAVAIVQLTNVKLEQIKREAMLLQYALGVASRDGKGRRFLEVALVKLLDWLWKCIGYHVCIALEGYLAASVPQRVWWCPTGALSFLPIHACGPYDAAQPGMPDLVISSYTPTISALLRAQKQKLNVQSASRSLLVVSQPNVPGLAPLPGAMEETDVLKSLFPHSGTFIAGPAATLTTVEAALRDNGWLHVISHGTQNSMNPLESAVALYDGPLTLSRLTHANLPHAEFAFLSACHSAKGTTWVPDESMHLAAGMVFAGFRSVVATSWAIADKDAPEVTRRFYTYLTRKSLPPHATDAAEALHRAVQSLRKSGVSAQRWVPFIHLGA